MKAISARVLLFGDGTVDPVPCLRQLARDSKCSASLDVFLRITASALRSEIARSTSPSRETYPQFDSVLGLTEWYGSLSTPQITVFPVLLCIAQLGVLLREQELNPSILEASDHSPLYSIGLCNGMLAAAAAASCVSMADLLTVGPRLVCLNLRMMLALVDRSRAIDDSEGAWTFLTPGFTAKDHEPLIESFLGNEDPMPFAQQPYISAQSDVASTISGPPPTLSRYFDSTDTLRTARKVRTGINTACHASHLWSPDLHQILGDEAMWNSYPTREHVMSLSIHTGEPINVTNLGSLLLHALDEVLNKRFHWDLVLKKLCEHIQKSCTHATVFAVGPDRVSNSVRSTISESGVNASIANPLAAAAALETSLLPSADDIAVVGVSSRLPGAESLDEVWQLLREGRDSHGKIPPDRFDLSDHLDPDGRQPNTTSVPFGCFLDNPGAFDARMFNMSPREAGQTDPSQRLALLTTYEALEMAGYSPNSLPSFTSERIATFWGQTVDDYRETNASQNVDVYYVPGGVRAFGPGRLNYHFKWEGPSMSVDTACSSSALAVQLAFQSLRSGECDMAIAGGANIITGPDMYAGLCRGGFLSKTGQCKTFDDGADGYCRGEGVGSVVLKRLQDALAENDNVLAVIKSCSTNHSAHAESITRPDSSAQVKVMRQILHDANIDPNDIDYVEMHGTGTQAGDAAEFDSVSEIFAKDRDRRCPLFVGSIKANVGHGEAAAGINSLVKTILMLRYSAIPPCIGIKDKINSKFSPTHLEKITINRQLHPFNKQEAKTRRLLLNSFNAAGGNTAIVIEDAPERNPKTSDPRSSHIVVLSGHTQKAFCGNRENLLRFLKQSQDCKLPDLAYTTTARRMHHSKRKTYVAEDISRLVRILSQEVKTQKAAVEAARNQPKAVFIFTGQGSHSLEMARQLIRTCVPFSSKLEQYESICRNQGLPSFLDFIRHDFSAPPSVAAFQVSIVAIQMALTAVLRAWGVTPYAVIGHSIGEYAALASAGVLNEADALYITGQRALAVERLCKPGEYSMLSVTTELETLEEALSNLGLKSCVTACHNGPSSVVISGPVEDISQLTDHLKESNIPHKLLEVNFGFHSAQMEQVGQNIRRFSSNVRFSTPKIPIASTLLGKVVSTAGIFGRDYLASHTTEPVQFSRASQALSGFLGKPAEALWLEIGTHPMFASSIVSTLNIPTGQISYVLRRDEDPWRSISGALAKAFELGINVDWTEYHKTHLGSLSAVELPRYSFDLSSHWIPYRNSWRLHKGQSKPEITKSPIIDPKLAPFHYVQYEDVSKEAYKTQLICDASQKEFSAMVFGHMVDGVALCPSSVYAHLAFHAAAYVLQRKTGANSPEFTVFDLQSMNIISPFKLGSRDDSPFALKVNVEWNAKNPHDIQVKFTTDGNVEEIIHCHCTVSKGNSVQWQGSWREHEYLIQSQIDLLKGSEKRCVDTMNRSMIYNLFSSAIVNYSNEYRLIQRMSIDYECNEAVAELKLPDTIKVKNGSPGPCTLDAVMHMAGFILNSNPQFSQDTVFIASGWKSLRLTEALSPSGTYVCYTRMLSEEDSNVFIGNVSILSRGKIIGICRGLKFHRLRRKSLHMLLGSSTEPKKDSSRQVSKTALKRRKPEAPNSAKTYLDPKRDAAASFSPVVSEDPCDIVLNDVAAETSTPVSDLSDDTRLSELGIDSLLSISLLNRFKERTGADLPVDTFSVCATIGALKDFLGEKLCSVGGKTSTNGLNERSSGISREKVDKSSVNDKLSPKMISDTPIPSDNKKPWFSKFETLCDIIAIEVGMDANDVKMAATVSELGIDSLLTISISNEFQTQTGEKLGARFFYDNPTIASIVEQLDRPSPAGSPGTPDSQASKSTSETSLGILSIPSEPKSISPASPDTEGNLPPADPSAYSCVSMLLQNSPRSDRSALFFLPDGSGSLFSYIHMPKINPDVAVYALDSPFHRNPADYILSFDAVASIYVREIRRLQPHGPYMIGGWSLGGVHAFEGRTAATRGGRVGREADHDR